MSSEQLSAEQIEAIESEMRRLETDPNVDKHALRLFMQSPMPCGHSVGELMTCDKPPFGCAACLAIDRLRQRVGDLEAELKAIRVHADRREREMKRQ